MHTLNLAGNRLERIPMPLLTLPALTSINLENNAIRSIPPHIGQQSQLRALCLTGNPVRAVRQTILCGSTEHFLEYLRSRIPESEWTRLDEARAAQRDAYESIREEVVAEQERSRTSEHAKALAREEAQLGAKPGDWAAGIPKPAPTGVRPDPAPLREEMRQIEERLAAGGLPHAREQAMKRRVVHLRSKLATLERGKYY